MPGATKDGMPVIGTNFSGPKDNSPRMTTLQSKKVEESLEEIEKIMAPKTPEGGEEKPLTKEEEYLKNLTDAGVSVKESRLIMEQMVTKGYYEEDYKIGSVTLTLRTRVYEDMIRTQRALEIERPEYATAVQELLNRYNTAASIVRFGEHSFKHEDPMTATDEEMDAAFAQRVRFMKRLSQYVALKIQQHTYSFDQKMVAVFGEGAPQDF